MNQFHEYGLFAEVMDTHDSWNSQADNCVNKSQEHSNKGKLVCVSDLEVNDDHKRALSIIWYMKKY